MRRLGLAVFTAASLALIAATPSSSMAQCQVSGNGGSCELDANVSMTIGRVILLQMSTASTPLTTPTAADFDAGFNSTTGPVLTVGANMPWRLRMRAATAVWGATDTSPGAPARTNKPVGDLLWSRFVGGPFVAMTTTNVTLASANATASNVTSLFFRTNYAWLLDTPGIYTLGIIFTLTSP